MAVKRTIETEACEVCDKVAPKRTHPCRFEKGCTCWYGKPCNAKEGAK